MLLFILIISAGVAWSILAFIGVQRGLQGSVIVYRSWSDCALTTVLVALLVIDLITGTWPADETLIVRILTLFVALPWLLMTKAANQRSRSLWVVAPAKLTLIFLTGLLSFLALSYAIEVLSSKTEPHRRLTSGASAILTAGLALGLFRIIRHLATRSSPAQPRISLHLGSIRSV